MPLFLTVYCVFISNFNSECSVDDLGKKHFWALGQSHNSVTNLDKWRKLDG